MRSATLGASLGVARRWALLLGLAAASLAVSSPAGARTLPLVERLRGELAAASTETLQAFERTLVERLYLGDGRFSLRNARDLHDVVSLVAAADALPGRPASEPARDPDPPAPAPAAPDTAALMVRVRATWLIHAAGVEWEARAPWRAAVEALPDTATGSRERELFEALRDSVAGLREVGRVRFPNALHAALAAGVTSPELHHLRGLWLEREGRLDEATVALRQAIDGRATVASTVDLVRILARAGHPRQAEALGASLVERAPGARGVVLASLAEQAARDATAGFEAAASTTDVDALAAQARRYDLLGRRGAATRTLDRLLAAAPGHPATVHVVGELWLRWRRPERIATFLATARAEGRWSADHAALQVAGVLAARLAAARGEAAHPLAQADVREDLQLLSLRGGRAGRASAQRAAIALAGTEERPQARAIAQAIEAADPLDPVTARVAAGVWLMVGRPLDAIAALSTCLDAAAERADAVPGAGSVRDELAALELAYGAHRADRDLVRRGLDRLVGPDRAASPIAAYLWAVGGRLNAWMGNRTAQGDDASALAELAPLVDQLDPATALGRAGGRAAALSVAALALATGDAAMASGALRVAGRYGEGGALSWLAAGQRALASDDLSGAAAFLDEAVSWASAGRERWLAHKWRALAANRGQEPAAAEEHLRAMLKTWAEASVGDVKTSRRPLGLLTGGVEVRVELRPGDGPWLDVALTVLPVLVADFPHDRAQIESVLRKVAPR